MKQKNWLSRNWLILVTGLVIGFAAVFLTSQGNPPNMGFCIACFLRDISGSVKLHSTAAVQYFRPEILGIVLGSMLMAIASKEFKGKGGSSPVTRFFLGALVMIGALVFLGCPLRMVIRIGGGDINAIVGLVGFLAGILVGVVFLKKGFSLRRAYEQSKVEAAAFPAVLVVTAILCTYYGSRVFLSSVTGPGSMHAPFVLSLVVGLIVGALCQRSRLCMAGGLRDVVMFKDFTLIAGFAAILVAVVVGNLIFGNGLHFGMKSQPIAHTDGIWNFLSMALVGWGSILLGGCPLRQLVLAGEGNSDSAITVLGMLAGAAFSHNFRLASAGSSKTNPDGMVTRGGKLAVVFGLVVLLVVSLVNIQREKKKNG